VIAAGGTGRPYVTTDTAAVSFGLELDCDVVLKATKVDGVYNKDPAKFPDAVKIEHMSFDEAVSNGAITVMDKAALGLAMEHQLHVVVFNALSEGSIVDVASGKPIGTKIS
jgi:uridylate kinase